MKNYIIIIVVSIFVSGCASIYLAPNGQSIVNKHETVAIIQPKVSIKARKNIDAEAIKESQRTSSLEFQQEIYKFLLKRKSQGKMHVNIQDVEETNVILLRSSNKNLTTKEMCEVLGVDAVMTSNFALSKPMSTGAALALALVGFVGSTNEVVVSLNIKNCDDSVLLWKYDHKYSGGIGTSPSTLVEGLMRHASKKMPYFIK